MIAYPAYHGMPQWDPVYEILEETIHIPDVYNDTEWYEGNNSVIWCARKEWLKGKKVKDYIPNNKTKCIVKLTKVGEGQPVAEPQVDAETQKSMMAFYYKKQEEMKVLEADTDDGYLNAPWANPNSLKAQMQGMGGSIGFRSGK